MVVILKYVIQLAILGAVIWLVYNMINPPTKDDPEDRQIN